MNAAQMVAKTLEDFDSNKDGSLTQDEIDAMPEFRKAGMKQADADGNGTVSKDELTKVTEAFIKMRQQGGGGGGGPRGPGNGGGGRGQ